jgi:hypothetical protein
VPEVSGLAELNELLRAACERDLVEEQASHDGPTVVVDTSDAVVGA